MTELAHWFDLVSTWWPVRVFGFCGALAVTYQMLRHVSRFTYRFSRAVHELGRDLRALRHLAQLHRARTVIPNERENEQTLNGSATTISANVTKTEMPMSELET